VIHTDHRFLEAVESAVGELEARTDAEVVVVASGRSGHYRDVAMAAATAVALVLLVAMLYVPVVIPPWGVVVELLVVWPLAAWLCNGPRTIRLLASKDRLQRQVREAAASEFVHEGIYATPQHTGILVYLSALEGQVEVLSDVGIDGRVPPGEWRKATAEFAYEDLDHFLHGLEQISEVLAKYVPPVDDPNRLELSDAPRVRP
jgi:putative membrane protein